MRLSGTRTAIIASTALAASLALLAGGPGSATAATRQLGAHGANGRPLPADPTRTSAAPSSAAATDQGPDTHRSAGLRALLSEKDSDRGGDSATLSALCQKFVGRPNPYGNPAPNVDQIVGDTIVTVGTQTGCSAAQNENTIAVNPENPKNLVAGTNDYRIFNSREQRNDASGWAYTTFDGGKTWTNVQLPHLTFQTGGTGPFAYMDSAGDPVLAFGPHNTVYYGNIVFSRAAPTGAGTEAGNGIAVSVSHDGGLHWDEPTLVQLDGVDAAGNPTASRIFNDKIWLAADKSSGRVYATWTRFADNPDGSYKESPIVVAASQDYGHSFARFRRVDVALDDFTHGLTPYSQGSNPQVGDDGTLYIAYEGEICATLACDQFGITDRDVTVVAKSRDHGRTFTKSVVDTNFDFPFSDRLGTLVLTGENFRINSYPQLAMDPRTKVLVVTWNDDRNGKYGADGASIRSNGDNIVAFSRNGSSWSRPVVVGTPQDEVFGAVAAYGGVVAVTSYTRHYDRDGINLDYAYWSSTDARSDGTVPIRRITTHSSNPRVQFVGTDDEGKTVQGLFIGDYTGVAMGSDGLLHPNWTDFRGRPGKTTPNQDAYTQTVRL